MKWTVMLVYPNVVDLETYVATVESKGPCLAAHKAKREAVKANKANGDDYDLDDFAVLCVVPGEQELYCPQDDLLTSATKYDVEVDKFFSAMPKKIRRTA